MDVSIEDDPGVESPPRKKVKIDDSTAVSPSHVASVGAYDMEDSVAEAIKAQAGKELSAGIEAFVSNDGGFHGILKRRYHDFQVNEIMPNGTVVRLDDPKLLEPPKMSLDVDTDQQEKSTNLESADVKSAKNVASSTQDANGAVDDDDNKDDGKAKVQVPDDTKQASEEMQVIYDLSTGENKDSTRAHIELTDESFTRLQKYFGMEEIKKLASLFREVSEAVHNDTKAYSFVDSIPLDDKEDRKAVHQMIRTIFLGRIESNHQDGNAVRCTAASSALSRKGKARSKRGKSAAQPLRFDQLGGDYMHFTLCKENRDSGDVLGFISAKLNMKNQKAFGMAGNKDRRAVTVQRVCGYRIKADRFLALNNIIKQCRVGDCCYSQDKLQLGDLAGNEFLIVLRDCTVQVSDSVSTVQSSEDITRYISQGLHNLRNKGFINYYGLQRFGSFAASTDAVGQYILQQEYKAAVDTILQFSTEALEAAQVDDSKEIVSHDDKKRAQAIHWFLTKSEPTTKILETLPRRFTAEYAIVSFLSKSKDQINPYYRGALESIPRNTRNLYPHAYQSLIWNLAATNRWNLAPGKLLPGDLVLISNTPKEAPGSNTTDFDPIYAPEVPQHSIEKAYILTEQDIASNRFTIFDIVLPTPGYDVTYPPFMLPFYKASMQQHGNLDPEDMRRKWREVSLPGSYRKLLGRPGESWAVDHVWYRDPEAQITLTDLDKLEVKKQRGDLQEGELWRETASGIALAKDIVSGERLAVLLRFQLPSSTYATMALRELMKGGAVEYKPEFSGGRGV